MKLKKSQICERAACLLEEVGWHRGSIYRTDRDTGEVTSMCMLGAMTVAGYGTLKLHGAANDPDVAPNVHLAHEIRFEKESAGEFMSATGERRVPLTVWNDRRSRAKEEVVAKLRKWAADYKAKGE